MSAVSTIPRKKMVAMVIGMFVVPCLFFGGYMLLKHSSKSEVSGSISLGEKRDTPLTPNRCESGVLSEDAPRSRPQFHGVDLFDGGQPSRRVRVIDDAEKGLVVTIRNGDAAPVVVDRGACATFKATIRETGTMILDHYGLEGALTLDCPEIVADVKFASCYDGS